MSKQSVSTTLMSCNWEFFSGFEGTEHLLAQTAADDHYRFRFILLTPLGAPAC